MIFSIVILTNNTYLRPYDTAIVLYNNKIMEASKELQSAPEK